MHEETFRRLNPTETIYEYLPIIIEAFVSFYGESERQRITDKFQNMLVIGYSSPDDMRHIILACNKEESNKLINEFLDKLTKDEQEKEKLKKLFLDNTELNYSNLHPLYRYINYCNKNNVNDFNKKQVVDFLKKIEPTTTIDNLDELIKKGRFKSIDKIVPLYKKMLKKYQKHEKRIELYKEYTDSCQKLISSLQKKYTKKVLEEIKDLFTEDEWKGIEESLNDKYLTSIRNISGKTRNYLSSSLDATSLIDAFSEESEELLLTGAEWQQKSIKEDRIQYFKNLGLDLGDDYDAYLNHPKAMELTPSKDVVERIKNIKDKCYTKMMNEYYSSLPNYQKNRARIDALDLIDKDDGYDASAYENKKTMITTNIKKVGQEYIMYPILFAYINNYNYYLDACLIHELNHVLELHLESVEQTRYHGTCGWDIIDTNISSEREASVSLEDDRTKRNYELFNEIINELIAQEISEILSQSGVCIFNFKEQKRIKGGTSYERTMFIAREFYNKYKELIIESRKNGDMTKLFEVIGKENFEELNQLFGIFYEHFGNKIMLQVYEDLKNNVETEETKKIKEIMSKRDEIIKRMEEHNYKKTNTR